MDEDGGGLQSHAELLRFLYERRAVGDIEPLLNALSDDVEWRSLGKPGLLPWSGRWIGKQGVVDFFNAVAGAVDVLGFELDDYIEDEEQVAWSCRLSYRPHNSTRIEQTEKVDVFTFRDDRIVKFWEIFHVDRVATVLGVRPQA